MERRAELSTPRIDPAGRNTTVIREESPVDLQHQRRIAALKEALFIYAALTGAAALVGEHYTASAACFVIAGALWGEPHLRRWLGER